jgi:uncharacterized protein (UPF0179 family)
MKLGVVHLVSFRAQRLTYARIGHSFLICSFLVDCGGCEGHVCDIAASRVSNLPTRALLRSMKLVIGARQSDLHEESNKRECHFRLGKGRRDPY